MLVHDRHPHATAARRFRSAATAPLQPGWAGRTGAIVTAAVLIPVLCALFAQTSGPDDATNVPLTASSVVRDGAGRVGLRVVSVEGGSALRAGDVVTAVGGVPVVSSSFPARHVGEQVDYTLTRDGRSITVPVTLRTAAWRSRFADQWSMYALLLFLLPIAAYVFTRRPRERAAQLMLAAGPCFTIGTVSSPLGARIVDLTGGRGVAVYVVAEFANAALWSVLLHFTLAFPEPSQFIARRPWSVAAVYALPAVLCVADVGWLVARGSNDLAVRMAAVGSSSVAALVVPPLLVVSLLVAYRRSPDEVTRKRMRWVVASLAGAALLYFSLGQVSEWTRGRPLVGYDWLELLFAGGPIAIASAVLAHNLFDLRPTIKRSLVFVLLAAPLVGLYVAVLAIASRAFPTHSIFVALVAGGAASLVLRRVHNGVQRAVSRLVYGVRDDPSELVSRINRAVEDVTPSGVLRQLTETLASALRLSYAAIELDAAVGEDDIVVRTGSIDGPTQSLPLLLPSPATGRLVLAVGAGREPFGRADRRLMGSLIDHVSRVAEVVLLNDALLRSRGRIVSAREEERRRLQQDLHDGIGPSLAAQSMQLDLARTMMRADADAAEAVLIAAARSTQEVIEEIRRVVDDLRPRVLGQLGLRSAIDERVRAFAGGSNAPHMSLDARGRLENIPAATEVAAYRIATEAMANVARHARARRCDVALSAGQGQLTVCVRDDGIGMTGAEPAGVGLWSMRERADELGGQLRVESRSGGGTHIHATLPLTGPAAASQD